MDQLGKAKQSKDGIHHFEGVAKKQKGCRSMAEERRGRGRSWRGEYGRSFLIRLEITNI